jgi:hypothetical protein
MLRPTRSRLVTKIDIVPARRSCNLIKTKSFAVHFVGIFDFAFSEATVGWLTLGPLPRLRGEVGFLGRCSGEWRGFNLDAERRPECRGIGRG